MGWLVSWVCERGVGEGVWLVVVSCYHWAEREKRVLSVLRRDMAGFVVGVGECGWRACCSGVGDLQHLDSLDIECICLDFE